MTMFSERYIFLHGKEAWNRAHAVAKMCDLFKEDDEDEQISDIKRFCYNCQYRRWTNSPFICMKMREKNNIKPWHPKQKNRSV